MELTTDNAMMNVKFTQTYILLCLLSSNRNVIGGGGGGCCGCRCGCSVDFGDGDGSDSSSNV
jgi:hypothetical protein